MNSIINLTPHSVVILSPSCAEYNPRTRSYSLKGEPVVLRELPSQGIIRCAQTELERDSFDGIPIIEVSYGAIDGLPEEQDGTFYVVSALAANAGRAAGRSDLLIPSRLVRDSSGNIVGCLALAK